jgi:hypothetical protein
MNYLGKKLSFKLNTFFLFIKYISVIYKQMVETREEKERRLKLQKYLLLNPRGDGIKDAEIERRVRINRKIEDYLYDLSNNNKSTFELLYKYCKDCVEYYKQNPPTQTFDITRFADFIDYTNFNNVSDADIQVFNDWEFQLQQTLALKDE